MLTKPTDDEFKTWVAHLGHAWYGDEEGDAPVMLRDTVEALDTFRWLVSGTAYTVTEIKGSLVGVNGFPAEMHCSRFKLIRRAEQ